MPTLRIAIAFWIGLLPVLLLGCGTREFETVKGTVTFDGEPLPKGDVIFQPTDPKYGPDASMIVDGKFTFPARPGNRKVIIRAVRLVPGKKGPMGEDAHEDYIPAKYNDETTLTAEVKSGEKNEFVFTLTSK